MHRLTSFLIGLFALVAFSSPARAGEVDDLVHRADHVLRGKTTAALMKMRVHTKSFDRSYSMVYWADDHGSKNRALVKILGPARWRGHGTLKVGGRLSLYDPSADRVTVLSSSMLGDSWMGSHFTNDDLVKDSRYSDDFDVALTGRGDAEGAATYEFTLTPKPDAAVVWGKVTVTIRQADLLPVSQVFYDEDGAAVRKLEFKEYKTVSGRTMPTVMKMTPLDQSGEYTQVAWKKMAFDVALEPSFFTLQRLKSI